MTLQGWTLILLFTALTIALAKPMGMWLFALYEGRGTRHCIACWGRWNAAFIALPVSIPRLSNPGDAMRSTCWCFRLRWRSSPMRSCGFRQCCR